MEKKKYNSPSSLPVTQFCPASGNLSRQYGAGRAAVMSQVFHASCAAETDSQKEELAKLMHSLTDDEMQKVMACKKPKEAVFPTFKLLYEDAEKEVEMGLSEDGKCVPYDAENILTKGRMDMGWAVALANESITLAVVADIKWSLWTTGDPDNLQNIAYGLMYADKFNCDELICGIWGGQEGKWNWGTRWDLLWDKGTLLEKVKHAAQNVSNEYVTGAHCRQCYARMHCPEHCSADSSFLSPPENASEVEVARMLLKVQAVEDQVKWAKEYCYECARRFDGLRLDDKVFSPRAYRWVKVRDEKKE